MIVLVSIVASLIEMIFLHQGVRYQFEVFSTWTSTEKIAFGFQSDFDTNESILGFFSEYA